MVLARYIGRVSRHYNISKDQVELAIFGEIGELVNT